MDHPLVIRVSLDTALFSTNDELILNVKEVIKEKKWTYSKKNSFDIGVFSIKSYNNIYKTTYDLQHWSHKDKKFTLYAFDMTNNFWVLHDETDNQHYEVLHIDQVKNQYIQPNLLKYFTGREIN
jgi:hypothetical protein